MRQDATILFLNHFCGDRVQELTISGVRRYAGAQGWKVVPVASGKSRPRDVAVLLSIHRHVAGCIVDCSDGSDCLAPRLFGRIPIVCLHATPALRGEGVCRVSADNEAIARAAYRELSAGHPAAFGVVGYRGATEWTLVRERAFAALASGPGARCSVFDMRLDGNEKTSARRSAALARWVAGLPKRTAVFAVTDHCAAEVVAAAHEAGRSIPRELTLCGVDNLEAVCEATRPAITSIQLDHERTGFLAAKMLEDASDSGSATVGPLLAVRRESTRGSGRREAFVLEAMDMIRREACDGLTAAALAARFPCSRSLFYLRFRETMGHGVLDEIQNVRLDRVFTLLAKTDTPIGAIPDFCGFRSAIALKWIFRKRTGMSMREWRVRNRR